LKTTIKSSFLQASINHKGAEIFELFANKTNFIWEGNPSFWGKHSPVLFPIVGILKDNRFIFEEKEYNLPRHGFARDLPFELIKKDENSATFLLQSSQKTKLIFPFDFDLEMCYKLNDNALNISYKVTNTGKEKMPFSLGAHPAFALPNTFENYELLFERQEDLVSFELQNDLVSKKKSNITLKNRKLALSYMLFEKDALIFKSLQSKSIAILENGNPFLKISFDSFPNLGIWTKPNAPFLCIEPWAGYSDTTTANGNLFEKEAIQTLQPSESKSFQLEITIVKN
jgi:galactose mutarotase-like enzyme